LEALGKNKAKDHIRNKYGFDAEIEKYYRESYGSSSFKPECIVTMNYEGKQFYVTVSGYKDYINCYDSYQAEKIRLAAESSLNDALKDYSDLEITVGGYDARDYMTGADSFRRKNDQENYRLYRKYFTGDNLAEVLEYDNDTVNIRRYCVKGDVSGYDIPEKAKEALPGIQINVKMYSYDTPAEAEKRNGYHFREKHSVIVLRNGEIYNDEYEKNYNSEE
jgi:hypothetical protein